MLAKASFFALMVMPSASANMSRTMSIDRAAALPLLAFPDEPGVFRKAAAVDDEGLAEAVRQRRRGRGCSPG